MIRELGQLLREAALFIREKRKELRNQRRRGAASFAKKTVAGTSERTRIARPVSSDDAKEAHPDDEDELPPNFQRILEEGARISDEFDKVTELYKPPTEPAAPTQTT